MQEARFSELAVGLWLTKEDEEDALFRVDAVLDDMVRLARFDDGVFKYRWKVWDHMFDEAGYFVRDKPWSPPAPPEPTLGAETGWLAPDGKLYPCKYWEHVNLGTKLMFAYKVDNLEEAGFIKLQKGRWHDPSDHSRKDVTQRQMDAMFDWCLARRVEMPRWACSPAGHL